MLGSRTQIIVVDPLHAKLCIFQRELQKKKERERKEDNDDDKGRNYVSLFDKFYAKLSFHV